MDLGFLGLGWARFGLGMTWIYQFGPFHYPLGRIIIQTQFGPKKFIFSLNNYPPHTIWPMSHVCMKKTFICQRLFSLFSLHSTMGPKVQLTHLDVDYQREEQAKTRARLDELKKPKVIT